MPEVLTESSWPPRYQLGDGYIGQALWTTGGGAVGDYVTGAVEAWMVMRFERGMEDRTVPRQYLVLAHSATEEDVAAAAGLS